MRRTFLGLPVVEELAGHLALLYEDRRGVRWIPKRNLHMTVEFLGPTSDDQIEVLSENLDHIESSPLTLEIEGLVCLPVLRKPRVLAVGVTPADELESLYRVVRSAAEEAGFSLKPPRLSPHVTVARLKGPDSEWLRRYLERHSPAVTSLGPYRVDRLNLYESELSRNGAEYSVLRSFRFRSG